MVVNPRQIDGHLADPVLEDLFNAGHTSKGRRLSD